MHIEIWHLEGEGRGRADVFDADAIRVGSAVDADVVLAGTEPFHATIERRDGAAWLVPDGAVRLNGRETGETRLQDGDVVTCGAHALRVRFAAGASRLPPKAGRLVRGAPAAGVTALFLAILVAGTYLAARAPARVEVDTELARQDAIRAAQQRAHEARMRTLRKELAHLEARVESGDRTAERQLGQVKRAMAQVETAVLERVSTEVERSLGANPELRAARDAVEKIERSDQAAERIIAQLGGSVCVIQGAYGFGRKVDGRFRFLREATPEMLEGLDIGRDKVPLVLDGDGPIFRVEYTGTGFLVDARGIVLTNRHIAEPWWRNDAALPLIEDGYETRFLYLRAYFPGDERAVEFERARTVLSHDADLGALFFAPRAPTPRAIPLADPRDLRPGRRVLLLGYPSGLDALLARTDEDVNGVGVDPVDILDHLAKRGFVRPLPTQGFVGDVLGDRVVFDAPTAVGGSGGPLLDMRGRVVAINYGILKAFSGANFGVPVDRAARLLERARATLPAGK